jgi:hypothetical protein
VDACGENWPAQRNRRRAEPVDGSHGSGLRKRPGQPLLQRGVDRGELGIEGGAETVDDRNDRKGNARRDQAVFDRGCARFVEQKTLDVMLQLRLQVTSPILSASVELRSII